MSDAATNTAHQHLIVLGSTLTALAVVREANRFGIATQIVDTRTGPAFASRLPAAKHLVEDGRGGIERASALVARTGASLIADSDHWLRHLIDHRELLGTAHVLHPPVSTLDTCLDKRAFARWCIDNGFATPRIFEGPADVEFPVLVRPAQTRHLQGDLPKAAVITNAADLVQLLARYENLGARPVLSQSLAFPDAAQYSIGLGRRAGGETRCLVARKVRPEADRCAGGSYVRTEHSPRIERLSVRFAERIGLYGIGELEVLEVAGELFVIEFNARPWVQFALSTRSRCNLLHFVMAPEPPTDEPQLDHAEWMDLPGDIYWCFSRSVGSCRNGRTSVLSWLRSVLRANCHARWSLHDPVPGIPRRLRPPFGRVS